MQGVFPTKPQDVVSDVMLSRLPDSSFTRRFAIPDGGRDARMTIWSLSWACLARVAGSIMPAGITGIMPAVKSAVIFTQVLSDVLSDVLSGARRAVPALTVALAVLLVADAAHASPSALTSGTPTGFDAAAKSVYELVTGGLGKTIAATAAGLGLVGLATGFNTRVSAGAVGAGAAVGFGPPVVLALAGTMVF